MSQVGTRAPVRTQGPHPRTGLLRRPEARLEAHPARQAAMAATEGTVDVIPVLAGHAADWAGAGGGPEAREPSMALGPGEDLLHGERAALARDPDRLTQ